MPAWHFLSPKKVLCRRSKFCHPRQSEFSSAIPLHYNKNSFAKAKLLHFNYRKSCITLSISAHNLRLLYQVLSVLLQLFLQSLRQWTCSLLCQHKLSFLLQLLLLQHLCFSEFLPLLIFYKKIMICQYVKYQFPKVCRFLRLHTSHSSSAVLRTLWEGTRSVRLWSEKFLLQQYYVSF